METDLLVTLCLSILLIVFIISCFICMITCDYEIDISEALI